MLSVPFTVPRAALSTPLPPGYAPHRGHAPDMETSILSHMWEPQWLYGCFMRSCAPGQVAPRMVEEMAQGRDSSWLGSVPDLVSTPEGIQGGNSREEQRGLSLVRKKGVHGG